ncbi:hypothetical protein EEX84_06850 [Planococcus salinus]|uniref:Immunity protein 30 domain-containing protein n=1 Tax=Planococcus salinus TaxID=1848460 RepID=A0A3M8P7N0_9BACL|nr:hypothetical protein EEX84_06850 [Planococcus salinus]
MGMLIDLLKREDLIREIDDFISETPTEEIPHVFYVLSLAKSRRDMLELLTDLAKGVDEELPSCIVVGLLYRNREQYTTKALYGKIDLLLALLKDQDSELVIQFRGLLEAYEAAQEAYGVRFKRKKARERMLAKNEKALIDMLSKFEHYANEFDDKNWES